ncbi:MAG: hypothetical protein AAGD28_07040 [Bacteroidota bacterium]
MKTLRTLITAICMFFGQEEAAEIHQTAVFQQVCEISIPFSAEELSSNPLPVFQPAKAFYTGEEKTFAKENTIMSFEEGHFYLADGFWNTFKQQPTERQEMIYLAQKD